MSFRPSYEGDPTVKRSLGEYRANYLYPSPFLDISSLAMPNSIYEMFRYCEYYYYNEGIVNTIVNKWTAFGLTDIIFTDKDGAPLDKGAKDVIDSIFDELKIKELLQDIGTEYHVYGNALLQHIQLSKRRYRCGDCGHSYDMESIKHVKIKDFVVTGECVKCKTTKIFQPVDIQAKTNSIRFKLINPITLRPRHSQYTGETVWYQSIPADDIKALQQGDKFMHEYTPKIVIDAAKKKTAIKLASTEVYHFKNKTLSGWESCWGKPLIQPILKELFQLQILMKAQESIAMDRIIPFSVIYPLAQQEGSSPGGYSMGIDKGAFRANMAKELQAHRMDPNRKMISSMPVGEVKLGGDAKQLTLYSEISEMYKNIVIKLGFPQELMFGGMSWSSSSVSLRMVEKEYLNYRTRLEDVLNNFILPKVKIHYQLNGDIKAKFTKFKMADDPAFLSLIANLASSDKVSLSKFLNEINYSTPDEELESFKADYQLEIKKQREREKLKAFYAETGEINGTTFGAEEEEIPEQGAEATDTEESAAAKPTAKKESTDKTSAKKAPVKKEASAEMSGDDKKAYTMSPAELKRTVSGLKAMNAEERKPVMLNIKNGYPALYKQVVEAMK
jgi:hypothetical protein